MDHIKAYRLVKVFVTVSMAAMFIFIDGTILLNRSYNLYLLFIPLELLFVAVWVLIVKFNKTSVYKIKTDNGKIDIFTEGGNYTVRAEKISVRRGAFFCTLYFDNVKLRANSSVKSVGDFLYKYQNIYKKLSK